MANSSLGHGGSRGFPSKESRADSLQSSYPPVHNQVDAADEEETLSISELVHAIDSHVEMDDPKVTSNLHAAEDGQGHAPAIDQPTRNAPDDVIQLTPYNGSV